jgi:iron complex transport system ATP-binding protein
MRNLSCGYAPDVPVLSSISLDISAGGLICILGRNGVGKTTLFRTLLGSLPPLGGEVLLDGQNLFAMSRRARAEKIAYVPQSHDPPFAFTAFDIVLMGRAGLLPAVSPPSKNDKGRAREAMETLGIAHLAGRPYTALSGGERQMVLIARALCQGAQYLLLDEPAANLDVANQMRVLGVLRDLADAGCGVAFTSHDPGHALALDAEVVAIRSREDLVSGRASDILDSALAEALYGVRAQVVTARDEKRGRDVKAFVSFPD